MSDERVTHPTDIHTIAVEQVGDEARTWLTGHGYTLPVNGPRIVARHNQRVERVYLTDLAPDRLREIARNVAPVWGAEYVEPPAASVQQSIGDVTLDEAMRILHGGA